MYNRTWRNQMRLNKKASYLYCYWVLSFLLFSLFLPLPILANQPKTVRVGYYENDVFQEGAKKGAVRTGYAYDYYLKISEYTGWKYEYVYGTYAACYQALLDNKIDLIAGLAYIEKRNGLFFYPDEPMGHESYNILKHLSDEKITSDPTTLKGKKIGVLESAIVDSLKSYLNKNFIEAEIITFPDYSDVLEAFDKHVVDLVAVEGKETYGRKDAVILLKFGETDYYLCVNKERQDLLSELNEAQTMLRLYEPGFLNSLKEKYYPYMLYNFDFSPSEKNWLETHKNLRIGYLNNNLPFSDTNKSGVVTGLIKEIIPKIINKFGNHNIFITYKGYDNYNQLISDINNDAIDVVFPISKGLYFSEEKGIHQTNDVILTQNDLIYSGKYSENTTPNFAVIKNNPVLEYHIKKHFPNANFTYFSTLDECLNAVTIGAVNCTCVNSLLSNEILKKWKYRKLSNLDLNWHESNCFGVKLGNKGLLKLFNRGINSISSDFIHYHAYQYTKQLYPETLIDFVLNNLLLFALPILAIALLIIWLLVCDRKLKNSIIQEKEKAKQILEENNKNLENSKVALSLALKMAENASKAKSTFLSNMSHDIRTPMNAIIGFTSLATSNINDIEKVKDYLGKISISGQHLISLINDILDMSRIESGTVIKEMAEVNLPEVIKELDVIMRTNVEEKNQKFIIDADQIINKDVFTDKLLLKRVLLNILTNAHKYTPAGGEINFIIKENPSEKEGVSNYIFKITDNGIGMSKEFQEYIFEAFTREKNSTIKDIAGTGLGMAITKKIVDMMNGTISIASEIGKGSEFTVTIPCQICISRKSIISSQNISNQDISMPNFEGKRILVAEDNEMNRIIARAILEQAGLIVEEAIDGVQTVEMMKNSEAGYYNVILMDVQMPKMNGYEATKIIRNFEDPIKSNIPIIAVTANVFNEDIKMVLKAGMNEHLAKPYDIPKMMETLAKILSS